jgi:hypothetical protein
MQSWLTALLARRPTKVAAIALANKIARMAWAMMARGERTGQKQQSRRPWIAGGLAFLPYVAVFREGTVWGVEPAGGKFQPCVPPSVGTKAPVRPEELRLRTVGLKRLFCGGGTE